MDDDTPRTPSPRLLAHKWPAWGEEEAAHQISLPIKSNIPDLMLEEEQPHPDTISLLKARAERDLLHARFIDFKSRSNKAAVEKDRKMRSHLFAQKRLLLRKKVPRKGCLQLVVP
jgi:hypothetical protein